MCSLSFVNPILKIRFLRYGLGWLLMAPLFLFAQVKTISGTVKDDVGKPLQGVSVIVKGKTGGTQTGETGKFSIGASNGDVLVFSSMGFENYQVTVRDNTSYNINLKTASGTLNDVVVVGYGTQKRKDLTGAVGSVVMKDFEKAPVKSLDDALAGRVAGVVVQSSNGQPGSNANIVIRGAGSVSQNNSPLYVIDGYPSEVANFNTISPDDIESIDVLKDAASTAIYGARGSNGVILITTKRGKTGPPQVTYNGYYGWQATPKRIQIMNPYQYVNYLNDLYVDAPQVNAAGKLWLDSTYLKPPYTLNDYKTQRGEDMQDYVFRTGQNQSHNVAVRGGTEQTRYSLSANYTNQDGIIVNTGFKRYQARFALDQKVGNKLKVGINANYAYTENSGPQVSATNFYASSTFLYGVWGWRPVKSLTDSTTDLLNNFYDPLTDANYTVTQDYRVNPFINLQNQYTRTKNGNLTANAYAEYAFNKHLTLRITGGITTYTIETNIFNNAQTQSGSKYNANGVNGSISFAPYTSWNNDNLLTYTNTFNNAHHLTIMAGFSGQSVKTSLRGYSATQLPNPELGLDGLDIAAPANTTHSSSSSRSTLASGYARVNYDFQSRYLFSASVRADGSSKFLAGNKWGYFPAFSAGWRFSKEAFMKSITLISDSKLRFSYGASGNNRVPDFAYLPQLAGSSLGYWYSYNNKPTAVGAVISSPGNLNLKWETNYQTNIGLDVSFLNSRIDLSLDVYKRTTKNLLLNASLPYATAGVDPASGYANVGELQNKGLEITLNTTNIQTKDFTWSSNFNIAFNQNKITALANGQSALLSGSGTFFDTQFRLLFPYISAVGRPLGEMYGLIFDGVYQYADFDKMPNGTYVLKPDVTKNGSSTILPGDIKYRDINGDGTIDTKDYTIIGSGLPRYTGGFSNNFRYKNFDLSILLQYSVGNDVINANRYVFEGGIISNNPSLNQMASFDKRWTPGNPSNTLFRAGGMISANYSSRVVEDGSYLKLRTVSLGYTLPKNVFSKLKIQSIRTYASAQNLLTWTGYSGQDPEASSRQSNLTPGFDYATYPHSFSVVLGLNVNF